MKAKYQLAPSVHMVSDQDGAVLLDRSRGLVYGLNATAGVILRGISSGRNVDQIEGDVRQMFSDIHGEPHADIVALIERLVDAGLLLRSPGDAHT